MEELKKFRIGNIKVTDVVLLDVWEGLRKIKFTPIEVDFNSWEKTYVYTGYCDLFEEIIEGSVIPNYTPVFIKEGGDVEFVEFQ